MGGAGRAAGALLLAALLVALVALLKGRWWMWWTSTPSWKEAKYAMLGTPPRTSVTEEGKEGNKSTALVQGIGNSNQSQMTGTNAHHNVGTARVAVMVVGQWRGFTDPLFQGKKFSRKEEKMRGENLTSVQASHVVHVLQPLRTHGFLPDYLLCVDVVQEGQHPEIAEAWGFPAKNQRERILKCLKLVLARELQRNISYDIFVRVRPDLLVLTDLPALDDRLFCMWSRMRGAANVSGLTNEHLSWCYCKKTCCSEAVNQANGAGFLLDDVVMAAPRKAFLHVWQPKRRLQRSGRRLGAQQWSRIGTWKGPRGWAETIWTNQVLDAGVGICPLALRAVLIHPRTISHINPMRACGLLDGGPSIPQTHCGWPHASVDSLPWPPRSSPDQLFFP